MDIHGPCLCGLYLYLFGSNTYHNLAPNHGSPTTLLCCVSVVVAPFREATAYTILRSRLSIRSEL